MNGSPLRPEGELVTAERVLPSDDALAESRSAGRAATLPTEAPPPPATCTDLPAVSPPQSNAGQAPLHRPAGGLCYIVRRRPAARPIIEAQRL